MIEAVLFDMDGLMFDTETRNVGAWVEAGARHGHVVTEEMIHAHIGANVNFTRRPTTEHFGPELRFRRGAGRLRSGRGARRRSSAITPPGRTTRCPP